jgi:hypothetical protein
MGLRLSAADVLEAKKGFSCPKEQKHLPALKANFQIHHAGQPATPSVDRLPDGA